METAAVQQVDQVLKTTLAAFEKYKEFTQEQVDAIVLAAATEVSKSRLYLAQIAINETKRGVFEDKVIKVHFAAEYIYNLIRNKKTCGIIEQSALWGIIKVAEPMGVIAAITPVTNPTSTVVFKALLALKTRNGIVFAPHPGAKRCSIEAAKLILQAAVKAGAPEGIIGWIEEPSLDATQYLMQHRDTAIILATGGPGLVKAAYSSGKPAIGVGSGNAPALIDETADLQMAVTSILLSKTFDNGMICASEQSLIAVDSIYEALKQEFVARGAHILVGEEREKVAKFMIIDGHLNPQVVGQTAAKIAEMAGVKVPDITKVLIGEASEVGPQEAFSYEKLSPILGLYRVKDFAEGTAKAEKLVEFGGLGHTAVLYTDEANQDRIEYFGHVLKALRVLVNMPASHGGIGDLYNFYLEPSLTLGCGSYGGNIIGENIEVKHLLNIKIIAERRENMLWFVVPPQIYFKYGCITTALKNIAGHKKAFIVTDHSLVELGYLNDITATLESMGIQYDVFSDIKPDPDFSTVKIGLGRAISFKPDVVIAIGGGSPIDAAKIIRLMYDYPQVNFEEIAMRFLDIKKRICTIPDNPNKTMFVAIPTTSGTGSEVTPFAVITDKGVKYPIADYALTPNMAILEPNLVLNMPKSLTAIGGFDAITHALESVVSVTATDYTTALSLEAARILFKYLPRAYTEGAKNLRAREKVHYAATMAGMAFANAYLGVNHSLAHKLGAAFNIPHGTANALMICEVIRYNATESPTKFTAFPQYKVPKAVVRYARMADVLGLAKGGSHEEKVAALIQELEKIKRILNLPASIQEAGVNEQAFLAKVDEMALLAFDDQCTGSNPRYPLVSELRELYLKAYYKK